MAAAIQFLGGLAFPTGDSPLENLQLQGLSTGESPDTLPDTQLVQALSTVELVECVRNNNFFKS